MSERLPVSGADEGTWGEVLNRFLLVEHNPDGTLRQSAAIAAKVARGELVFSVKDHGAVGTGSTDDTAAIQSTIDAAFAAGGGVVYLPLGTYAVSPNPGLQVKSNVVLCGAGAGSIIKVPNGANTTGNVVKVESWSHVVLADFAVDGNRAQQASGTNFAVYLGGSHDCRVDRVYVHDTTGVGVHLYDCDGVVVTGCQAERNLYQGFEIEQVRGCQLHGNRGNDNDLHGLLISPGEVGGTGSSGNTVAGNTFDHNAQYGVSVNAANGDVSAWLNHGNVISGNQVIDNSQYGISVHKQDDHVISGNTVAGNGFFGVYLYQSQNNVVQGNTLLGNSQQGSGAYDEIMLEGWNDNHAHPASNNDVSHNAIVLNGPTRARWGVNEATPGDGPNVIVHNVVPVPGTSGTVNRQHDATVVSNPAGVAQVYGTQAIQGAAAGLDNAFPGVLRLYNNFVNGETQLVTPNGPVSFYVGGAKRFEVDTGGHVKAAVPVSSPSLSENGTSSFWVDEVANQLRVTVRYSDGTMKAGAIPLA